MTFSQRVARVCVDTVTIEPLTDPDGHAAGTQVTLETEPDSRE